MATERKHDGIEWSPWPGAWGLVATLLIPKHRGEYAATSPRPGGGGQTETPPASPLRIVFEYWKKRSAVADLVR